MPVGQALALLENTNALEQLRANGFTVSDFRAAVELPTTESTPNNSRQIISLNHLLYRFIRLVDGGWSCRWNICCVGSRGDYYRNHSGSDNLQKKVSIKYMYMLSSKLT